jgi:predicted DNA-binding ribbon-helix-helix protein
VTLLIENDYSVPKKRSVSVAGHKTSFTLEDNFWILLQHHAKNNQVSVASVVAILDKTRENYQNIGLSCMIRQFILNDIIKHTTIHI